MSNGEQKGLDVKGYKSHQPAEAIDRVNANKEIEERVLRILDEYQGHMNVDQRWLAMGRTHIEQGFMFVNRAIFQPNRVELPEDKTNGSA